MKLGLAPILVCLFLDGLAFFQGHDTRISLAMHDGVDFHLEVTRYARSDRGDEGSMRDRGREERFATIFADYRGAMERLAGAYERDFDRQRDLVQEIWFALWRALPTFKGHSSERTFIYRVAHNRASTHVAKRPTEQLDMDVALEQPDISPDPEQLVTLRWQHTELQARIAALPLTLRQVVTLALEGLTNGDIGQVLGISEGNVAVRLTRAKKRLVMGGSGT
jgi:RNA polymerase sigma factor (sigma-70 family)